MTIDLVIARFNEDISWRWKLRKDARLFVYNKGDGPERRLPNVGREAHTYLHHIIENYGNLSDYVFFSQADPGAHCPEFISIFNTWPASWGKTALYVAPGQNFLSDQPVRFFEKAAAGDDAANDCRGLWGELFSSPFPEAPVFSPGAMFVITGEMILTRSLPFYRRARDLARNRPRGPWEFERLWAYLWTSSAATKL